MNEMDDLCDQVRELCAGKSVEEIEEAISQSTIAGVVQDPAGLAQYFFDIVSAGEVPEDDAETTEEAPVADEEVD